jgi:hypothetical protein
VFTCSKGFSDKSTFNREQPLENILIFKYFDIQNKLTRMQTSDKIMEILKYGG